MEDGGLLLGQQEGEGGGSASQTTGLLDLLDGEGVGGSSGTPSRTTSAGVCV